MRILYFNTNSEKCFKYISFRRCPKCIQRGRTTEQTKLATSFFMLFFTTVLLGVGQGRKLLNLGLWPELSPKDELLKKQSEMIIPVNDCGRLFFMTCHTEIECCQRYELPALRALMAPYGPEMPQPALKHSVGTWWQPWCRTCTAAPLMPACCSCQGSADGFWMSSPPCLGLLIVPTGTTAGQSPWGCTPSKRAWPALG